MLKECKCIYVFPHPFALEHRFISHHMCSWSNMIIDAKRRGNVPSSITGILKRLAKRHKYSLNGWHRIWTGDQLPYLIYSPCFSNMGHDRWNNSLSSTPKKSASFSTDNMLEVLKVRMQEVLFEYVQTFLTFWNVMLMIHRIKKTCQA